MTKYPTSRFYVPNESELKPRNLEDITTLEIFALRLQGYNLPISKLLNRIGFSTGTDTHHYSRRKFELPDKARFLYLGGQFHHQDIPCSSYSISIGLRRTSEDPSEGEITMYWQHTSHNFRHTQDVTVWANYSYYPYIDTVVVEHVQGTLITAKDVDRVKKELQDKNLLDGRIMYERQLKDSKDKFYPHDGILAQWAHRDRSLLLGSIGLCLAREVTAEILFFYGDENIPSKNLYNRIYAVTKDNNTNPHTKVINGSTADLVNLKIKKDLC